MRLLVIEDYEPVQKALAKALREAGFAVDVSSDGEEGLWFAGSNDYDAIILDLMLPKIDGLTVLKRLRDAGKQTNVLILTARDQMPDRLKGLDSGADDYMVKPFVLAELVARVRMLVRRRYQDRNPLVEIGDLRIDTAGQRVWRGNREIKLTAREFAILEYLARRQGQVVSRTDIWNHVYDFNSDASSNVVDVYISLLRKKIESACPPTLIHTIRGRGYCLGR